MPSQTTRPASATAQPGIQNTPSESWKRRPDETIKAFESFSIYLRLGRKRSYARVLAESGRPPGYIRQVERWSSTHQWVARAEAFDTWLLEQRLAEIPKLADQTRLLVARRVRNLAKSLCDIGDGTIEDAPPSRVAAIREAFAVTGVSGPKKVEVTGKDGKAIQAEHTHTGLVEVDDANAADAIRRLAAAGALDAVLSSGSPKEGADDGKSKPDQ